MILIFLKNLQNQKNQSKLKKVLTLRNGIIFLNGRQKALNVFESGIFPKAKQGKGLTSILDYIASDHLNRVVKVSDHKHLKILTPKQMIQRLQITLAQVKTGNTSENLLNEIRQVKYLFHRAKEFTKKVHNNTMNSIKL